MEDEAIFGKLPMFLRWPDDWKASPLFWCYHQLYYVKYNTSCFY